MFGRGDITVTAS